MEITVGDYKHDDTIAKDRVISQTPAYGATVVQGTKVTVVISLGPEPEVKILDNLTFMAQEEAKAYLDRLGVKAEECLMVGNDAEEDMAARKLGMEVFLLTDCLINKKGVDIEAYPHGGFDELMAFIRNL